MNVFPTSTTVDVQERNARVALLPVGSFEQHGPHLPLATDSFIAIAICDAIALRWPVLQLPPIAISCSHEHVGFAGSVNVSARTLSAIVEDVSESLHLQGVDRVIVVNAHGGNYVLSNAVQEANAARPGSMALFPARADWDDARAAAGMVTSTHADMHAGELETSLMLSAFPGLVRDGWQRADTEVDDRRDLLIKGVRHYSPSGVIGSPSLATADKGHSILEALSDLAERLLA